MTTAMDHESASTASALTATPLRVLIVTRVIEPGGAERQLLAFLRNADTARLSIAVACFYRGSWHDQALAVPGIAVHDLGKRGRYDVAGFGSRLWRLASEFKPDIVYGYYGGWLPSFGVAKALRVPVVWGLRDADPFPRVGVRRQLIVEQLNRLCAQSVDWFIANSAAGAEAYAAAGYPAARMTVIPNGIDTTRFARDLSARARVRAEWKVAEADVVVGSLGRIDPRKNYGAAIRAVGRLARSNPALRLSIVGDGDATYREQLGALAVSLGIADRCIWPGHAERVADAMSAMDVFAMPSLSEGFPNVLCEAMACELPAVANDAGDARRIVGDTGFIVAVGDEDGLTERLAELTRPDALARRASLGLQARKRIADHFGTRRMAEETGGAFERLIRREPGSRGRPGSAPGPTE